MQENRENYDVILPIIHLSPKTKVHRPTPPRVQDPVLPRDHGFNKKVSRFTPPEMITGNTIFLRINRQEIPVQKNLKRNAIQKKWNYFIEEYYFFFAAVFFAAAFFTGFFAAAFFAAAMSFPPPTGKGYIFSQSVN